MIERFPNPDSAGDPGQRRPGLIRRRGRALRGRDRRGAALVEFAVVAPLFFATIFSIVEFGRLVMVEQIMTNAAREGARRAVLEQSTASEVEAAIAGYLDSTSIPGATVTVSPSDLSRAGFGEPIRVTVSVPYGDVSWLPASWLFRESSITASSVMCAERLE